MSDTPLSKTLDLRAGGTASRLATSQLRRLHRIVEGARQLATEGGLDGVRLRDIADISDVALGTLYRYFQSKEDILVFALAEEMAKFERRLAANPVEGASKGDRVSEFFALSTSEFTQNRPKFAKACIQAFASGGAKNVELVAGIHLRWVALILSALRGENCSPDEIHLGTSMSSEESVARILENVWVVGLVGWAGGIQSVEEIIEQVRRAVKLLLPSEGV